MPSDGGTLDRVLGALSDASVVMVGHSLSVSPVVVVQTAAKDYLVQACGGSEALCAFCTPEC